MCLPTYYVGMQVFKNLNMSYLHTALECDFPRCHVLRHTMHIHIYR